MTFLAPLFLFGALAVSLPILFHLIRRSTREKTPFSSLMFLLPSPPRLTRRSRLEHILLLLLRCLVLCLLAFGFARPFIKKAVPPAPPTAARRLLLLVDTSASMRQANLWADARNKADAIIRRTSPADQLALFTFDREAKPLVTFEEWNATPAAERAALASRKLADTSPGWSATHLGNALIAAAETLSESPVLRSASDEGGSIILITDLQEGSHLNQLQGYEWPKGIELSVETLKPKHASNAGLRLIAESDDASPSPPVLHSAFPPSVGSAKEGDEGGSSTIHHPSSSPIRVRVSNSSNSKLEQFKLGWAAPDGRTFLAKPMDIYVPAGQNRILTLEPANTPTLQRSNAPTPSSILLTDDEEDFDNTLFVAPPEPVRSTVLYLGTDSPQPSTPGPLYFLQRAFQETHRQAVQVLARSPDAPDLSTIIHDPSSTIPFLIATDPLPDPLARALHDEIAAGKTLLFAPKNETAAPTLARLLGLDHVALEEARPNNYAMLADIDFRHALFAPFADPRFSDFTKIHFWKYRRLDATAIPTARVLAKFDNDSPALLEVPVGKGRVLILTSGWQPEDSQLALSTKFVPLLYSLLELASPAAPLPAQYHVGDALPLQSQGKLSNSVPLTLPNGTQMAMDRTQQDFKTTFPGIYTLSSQPPVRFAVNIDPAESRTQPLPADQLEHLGVPMAHTQPSAFNPQRTQVRLHNSELENRQKLWRWFVVATLALLLCETWLAGRAARQQLATVKEAT